MMQSCNGLQLLRVGTETEQYYCVHNWTTGRSKKISSAGNKSLFFCYLAFEPLRSLNYKIIRFEKSSYSSNQIRFDCYSSETGEWDTSNITDELLWYIYIKKGVYWNGGIHWFDIHRWECHRFDVEARNFTLITMPPKGPTTDNSTQCRYIGECNGHLHLVSVNSRLSKEVNIFEIDRDSLKWFMKFKVHIGPLISQFPDMYYEGCALLMKYAGHSFSIVCVARGDNEEDEGLVMLIPGKVIFYRFISKNFEVLSHKLSKDFHLNTPRLPAYPLVATLFPLSE